jgi:hypothetical protein
MALPDAIERVAFPDFVPPEPGAPDFAEGELRGGGRMSPPRTIAACQGHRERRCLLCWRCG